MGGDEPIASWRQYAGEAGVIVKVAAALHECGTEPVTVTSPEFSTLLWGAPKKGVRRASDDDGGTEKAGWWSVNQAVGRWLALGNVRPMLIRGPANDLTVHLGTARHHRLDMAGLFGALAAQLLFVAVNRSGARICAACGTYFVPNRVQTGRRSFCHECGQKGKNKLASRDYRARRGEMQSTLRGSRTSANSKPSSRGERGSGRRRRRRHK
jgi:hypothetical protein